MIVKKLKNFFLRLFRRLFNGVTLGILCILVIAVVLLYTSIRLPKSALMMPFIPSLNSISKSSEREERSLYPTS